MNPVLLAATIAVWVSTVAIFVYYHQQVANKISDKRGRRNRSE
jgi:hypothetical protein